MTEKIDPDTGQILETEALAVREPQGHAMTLFGSDRPREAMARMKEVADVLADVIEQRKLYIAITDKKTGKVKKHVVIEGWTLLGSLLGVTPRTVSCEPALSQDGALLGFKAQVEAVTRDGHVVSAASALCMKSEKRGPWSYADDYALSSMAQTRAASKALRMPLGFVMELAGYETLPSEEVPPGGFEGSKDGAQAQGRAAPAPEPHEATKAPPAAKLDARGRPVISDGSIYHECPSCHGETVRINPSTGDAFCWKAAKGCGAKFTAKLWAMVSVPGPSTLDPAPPKWPDAKEADSVLDLTDTI